MRKKYCDMPKPMRERCCSEAAKGFKKYEPSGFPIKRQINSGKIRSESGGRVPGRTAPGFWYPVTAALCSRPRVGQVNGRDAASCPHVAVGRGRRNERGDHLGCCVVAATPDHVPVCGIVFRLHNNSRAHQTSRKHRGRGHFISNAFFPAGRRRTVGGLFNADQI